MKRPRMQQGVLASLFLLAFSPESSAQAIAFTPNSRGIALSNDSATLSRTTPAAPFSLATLTGVPEPSSLVLGLAVFLMIGYGWLRSRWTKDDHNLEEDEAEALTRESIPIEEKITA